jgi:FRG domain
MNFVTPEQIEEGDPFRLSVDSISKALEFAKTLKTRGYLFRGQTNDKWPVKSSAERLSESERTLAQEKIARFVAWARNTPQMNSVSANIDSLFAIGQHYGLATSFIDFTDDPEIAAFFACDMNREPDAGQHACIVCLNMQGFKEFWNGGYGTALLAHNPGTKLPEIIHIDVQNLWRLQSQHGCFLWNPIAEIEGFYDFDRIIFPYTRHDPALPSHERIYPKNQSSLEQLLTGFFMNEQLREGNAAISSLEGFSVHHITIEESGHDISSWYPDGIEPTPDWKDASRWDVIPNERAENALNSPPLLLHESVDASSAAQEILSNLTVDFIAASRSHGLFFSPQGTASMQPIIVRLHACIRRLWNGMRRLPFTDVEIREALEATIQFFLSAGRDARGIASELSDESFGVDQLYVDFTRNADGKGDYSKAYVSRLELIRAHTEKFVRLASEHLGKAEVGAMDLIQLRARPWQRFSFAGLRHLMVKELIPCQLVLRGDSPNEHALKTVIYFSPTDLKIFGLA